MTIPVDVRTPRDALRLARLLQALNPAAAFSGVPQAFLSFASATDHGQVVSRVPPIPSYCWIDTGEQIIVGLAGIFTAADGLKFFASVQQPLAPIGAALVNTSLLLVAGNVAQRLIPVAGGRPRSWVLSGHSYGGAIALVLSRVLSATGVVSDCQVCTFGSPRPGNEKLGEELRFATVRRWMNTGDPVPRFPLHLTEAPFLVSALAFTAAATWSSYVQPPGGVVVGRLGTLSPAQLPPQIVPISDLEFSVWLGGGSGMYSHAHNIDQYVARLVASMTTAAAKPDVPTPAAGGEASVSLTQTAFTEAQASAAAAAQADKKEVKGMVGHVPAPYMAKCVKTPSGYVVIWMDRIIHEAANKSNGRSLAKWLNTWLRKMTSAPTIHAADLQDSLADFLAAAGNAANGFNPTAHVV